MLNVKEVLETGDGDVEVRVSGDTLVLDTPESLTWLTPEEARWVAKRLIEEADRVENA